MNHTFSTLDDAGLERLARRRAGARMGWFIHAGVYVAVNALLILMAYRHGRDWAVYPALGWGIGLLAHGMAVQALGPVRTLHERLVTRELARLRSTQAAAGPRH